MPELRRYPYVLLDVFTHTPLEGNPLAVFTDARGLSDREMQAIARETNLSETTFILPRDPAIERERGVQVRIFTTMEELPFAGHPTLGTAYYLHRLSGATQYATQLELELKVGRIPVTFTTDASGRETGEMHTREPKFGAILTAEDVADATGVSLASIDTSLPIQTVTTGVPFTIVPLRSLIHMQALQIDRIRASEFASNHDSQFFYFFCRETKTPGATFHARMQFYNGEDPATGSAAGCFAAWAIEHGLLPSEQPGLIEQGLEIGRPSFLHIRGRKTASGVTDVRVGGGVVEIARGEFALQ